MFEKYLECVPGTEITCFFLKEKKILISKYKGHCEGSLHTIEAQPNKMEYGNS